MRIAFRPSVMELTTLTAKPALDRDGRLPGFHRERAALLILRLTIPAALAVAGCAGDGCADSEPCLDVEAIRRGEVDVSVRPHGAADQRVEVTLFPGVPAKPGGCYQIPNDLEITANGRRPDESLHALPRSVHNLTLFGPCEPQGQSAQVAFLVPATSEQLRITFSKDDDETTVAVTRLLLQPVDTLLPTTTLDPSATFFAELRPQAGTLPAGPCWTATVESGAGQRVHPAVVAEPIEAGVRVALDFSGSTAIPPGPAQLRLQSKTGDGCESVASIGCGDVWRCSVLMDTNHVLGPFAVDVL